MHWLHLNDVSPIWVITGAKYTTYGGLRGLNRDTGRRFFWNAQKLKDIVAWDCFLYKLLIGLEQATSGSINHFGSHVEVAFGIWLMATFIHVENYSCWLWEEKNLFSAGGLQPTVTKNYWIDFRETQIQVMTDNGHEEIWSNPALHDLIWQTLRKNDVKNRSKMRIYINNLCYICEMFPSLRMSEEFYRLRSFSINKGRLIKLGDSIASRFHMLALFSSISNKRKSLSLSLRRSRSPCSTTATNTSRWNKAWFSPKT